MTTLNGIGDTIRRARRDKTNPATGRPYSQQQAAQVIGTTREHWNRWERGVYRPGPEHAARLAEFLGIPLADIAPTEAAA